MAQNINLHGNVVFNIFLHHLCHLIFTIELDILRTITHLLYYAIFLKPFIFTQLHRWDDICEAPQNVSTITSDRSPHWFMRSPNRVISITIDLFVAHAFTPCGCQWIMVRHFFTHFQAPFGKLHPLRPHKTRGNQTRTINVVCAQVHTTWSSI